MLLNSNHSSPKGKVPSSSSAMKNGVDINVLLVFCQSFDSTVMSMCLGKRQRDDERPAEREKALRVDVQGVKDLTLKRLMAAGAAERTKEVPSLILCEGCHRRAPPAESPCDSWALVGECRFCSRRNLCIDCWTRCASCGMETCPLCSVKDYSGRDTVAVCLDCKRHQTQKPFIRL